MDQYSSQSTNRPRAASHSFSLRSDKSGGKSGRNSEPSQADKADKARRDSFLRGESKANPNAAVQEAQPSTRNVLEKVTLESVRSLPSKDTHGNIIAEPDLSNPTRSRWERPLDTIRSFERAVDGDYHRRTSSRANSDFDRSNQYSSRNSAYVESNRANGHYGGRSESYDGAAPPSRARFSRGGGEGARYYNGQSPQYGYRDGSHEGSDSTGPWGNGTDPSSQNSSFERLHGIGGKQRGQSPEYYGMSGDYNAPINEEVDDYGFPARQQQQPRRGMSSYGQPTQDSIPRTPISLGNSGSNPAYQKQGGSLPPQTRASPSQEKSKGWLSRRFSKSHK